MAAPRVRPGVAIGVGGEFLPAVSPRIVLQIEALEGCRRVWVASVASKGNRYQIVEATQGVGVGVTDRSVDVHIVSLRRKLGEAAPYLETVRGVGYRFAEGEGEEGEEE